MASTSGICRSFVEELLAGTHASADTYKIALFTSTASLDYTTTGYSNTNELATANGYTQGGATLTGFTVASNTKTVWLDFTTDPSWATATFTGARTALIYNSSKTNKAVAVYDFGADKAGGGGTFTLQFPVADASNALLRFTVP